MDTILVVNQHFAVGARTDDDVVHPVEGAQEGALAAAGRPDEGGYLIGMQANRDVVQRVGLAIVEIEFLDPDLERGLFDLGGTRRRSRDLRCGR